MNCRNTSKYLVRVLVGVTWTMTSLTCDEKLPSYVPPANILSLHVAKIEQLNDRQAPPNHQAVHIQLVGENIYEEVYLDSVNVKGSMRIWWKRKPQRYRTIYLTLENFTSRDLIHNGKLQLVPGQQFAVEATWNMKTDDSIYVPGPTEMTYDYPDNRICDYNIICGDPEGFIVEASLNVYDRLGYIVAEPKEFIFVGHLCNHCGVGPVCPPPPGGCGG